MKYALIGCERSATNHIASAVNNRLDSCTVCGIASEEMDEACADLTGITTESGPHAEIALTCMENGATGTIEGTVNVYLKNLEETLYIFGEKDTVKMDGTSTNNIHIWQFANDTEEDRKNQHLKATTSNVCGNEHTNLYTDMIEAILAGRQPYVAAVAGRDALENVLAVYKSQKTGLPVRLPLTDFASTDREGMF